VFEYFYYLNTNLEHKHPPDLSLPANSNRQETQPIWIPRPRSLHSCPTATTGIQESKGSGLSAAAAIAGDVTKHSIILSMADGNDENPEQGNSDHNRKRDTPDDEEDAQEDNPITSAMEPYFRLILKLERRLTKELKHLSTLDNNLLKDTTPKGLQIRLRPALHVNLSLDRQIQWETHLMQTSKMLQQLLKEHWQQAISDTKEELERVKARLRDMVPEEHFERIMKKVNTILNPERPKSTKARRRLGGSSEDQQ